MPDVRSPLFESQPVELWVQRVLDRAQSRLRGLSEPRLIDLLEDAVFHERKRLERATAKPGEKEAIDRISHALVRGDAQERVDAAASLVALWTREIHGRFDPRVYRVATGVLPRALTAMLSEPPRSLRGLRHWDLSISRRLRVEGDIAWLKDLTREATLILAPTHVSNMDSPILGLALYQAGLPPFVYGAGLNLFENPLVGWWMHRLGAYTVDRRKRAELYKDTLKDYSTLCLKGGFHSLFFPGGTRCRSGMIEDRVKKGLLGTGLDAWQENLREGKANPEIYVVPCTLNYQLVLEAGTLIDDHLAEAGGKRYIITDDEFSQPRVVASFARRVLDLDSAIVCRFGAPLDVLGNAVPRDPIERRDAAVRRRRYVTDAAGHVEADPQRDFRYTDRLATALVQAWPKDATILTTHLVARVAWRSLEDAQGTTDPFRLVRVEAPLRRIDKRRFLERLTRAMDRVREGAREGRWHQDLPRDASAALALALDRFGRFHATRAVADHGEDVMIEDPRLCLYYQNRLLTQPLEV
jgi:glycerol-3-phosphate O-acyltransferase